VEVLEVAPGLWWWTAPRPGAAEETGCAYYEAPGAIVLVDPAVPPEGSPDAERFWRALDGDVERLGRPVAVLLTAPRHAGAAAPVHRRYGSPEDPPLPAGVESRPAGAPGEVVYWLPEHAALLAGDALADDGAGGLRLGPGASAAALRPLLDLPVERVLAARGAPVLRGGGEALARALPLG
jgi:glyoxylase-like metal-dependent hydrolase (beta-lactamase superfamily II)